MPNGGVKPSCFVCKWASKSISRQPFTMDKNPITKPIECIKNGFSVWLPSNHVCANLGDNHEESGLSTFVKSTRIDRKAVYAWLEFSYQTEEHPHTPQYRHELVKLASFQEFSAWTLEQKQNAYAQAKNKKEQELISQSKDNRA